MTLLRLSATAAACSLASLLASTSASAASTVFGFEELSVPFHTAAPIPDGYAGATWSGWVLRLVTELNGSGLNSGNPSGVLAIGITAAPEISFAQAVTLDGIFAINPFSTLSYELYLGGAWVGSSGSRVAGGGAFMPSHYAGALDRIVFQPGNANGFSIDDLSIAPAAPVPEPASLGLMLAGVGALGLYRRRLRS